MRILGIDYGTKRIGLAISDITQTLASELGVWSVGEFWRDIEQTVRIQQINKVVVGLPVGVIGQETQATLAAKKFIDKLKHKLTVEVVSVDERFTTDLAKRLRPGKGHHDSLVAHILLQEYLDRSKLASR